MVRTRGPALLHHLKAGAIRWQSARGSRFTGEELGWCWGEAFERVPATAPSHGPRAGRRACVDKRAPNGERPS
ncbi:MAG: hypothetical protein KatS3mg061_1399 [Dehalococcoidia bacterium]|nr:MAG: hypothetical protein KatS3mg061_1399 [Dehalococcoidia bacterium]